MTWGWWQRLRDRWRAFRRRHQKVTLSLPCHLEVRQP